MNGKPANRVALAELLYFPIAYLLPPVELSRQFRETIRQPRLLYFCMKLSDTVVSPRSQNLRSFTSSMWHKPSQMPNAARTWTKMRQRRAHSPTHRQMPFTGRIAGDFRMSRGTRCNNRRSSWQPSERNTRLKHLRLLPR